MSEADLFASRFCRAEGQESPAARVREELVLVGRRFRNVLLTSLVLSRTLLLNELLI
jgi:hypothetical protein